MRTMIRRVAMAAALLPCLCCALPASASAQAAKQRSDIDAQYKWDLSSIFPNDEAWKADLENLKTGLDGFAAYKGRLAVSAANIRDVLRLRDKLSIVADNLVVYSKMKLDEDKRVSKYQEMQSQASDMSSRLANAASFIQPELLAMDGAKLLSYAATDPGLKPYEFMLRDLVRTKAHILSDKEEALLAGAQPVLEAPSRIFEMIDDADISFGNIKDENGKDVQLTRARYRSILEGPDRRMRRDASDMFAETYMKHINGLAASLASSVKKDHFVSSVRKYDGSLEAKLDANNIPVSVFRNLLSAASSNLAPLHRWASLRKKLLGVETLYTYDLNATLMREKPREYDWAEAKDLVLKGLSPMGKPYLDELAEGFNSGWIDVYETQGKDSGAYSWGTYTSHPYVLMNYNNSLDNVLTLSHEMGHAMNRLWTNRNEPYHYSDNPLFTAEVASICNSALMMKYMIANARTKDEKAYLLTKYIEQIVGTFYTQIMFSEFELAMHDRVRSGGALSVDFFRKTYRDIYQKYWGPELVIGPLNDISGMRISHFYRSFYVYQYATSYAAAQMLSDRIVRGESGAVEAYYRFLRTGTSEYPVEVLKKAGVDMTTPEPVAGTIKLFGELVDQLSALMADKG